MEINQEYLNKFKVTKSVKKARRDLVIDDISRLTGVNVKAIYWKTARPVWIPTEWLEEWYVTACMQFGEVGKRVKFWQLLKESKKCSTTK